MFGSGFGAESEARDAQRHSTGRRHGPREMTNELGQPNTATDNTVLAQKAFENRRAVQQQNMEKAPSFMEQMYSNDASRNGGGGGGRQASQQPPGAAKKNNNQGRDHLNLFSWDEHSSGGNKELGVAPRRGVVERSEAELRSLRQKDDAVKRDGDARKFEKNKDGNFLRFSENSPQPTRKPLSPQNKAAPFAVDYPQCDVPDKDANHRPLRRRPPPQKDVESSEFDGFPGMGRQSREKNAEHLERRGQESNIFPPSMTPSSAGASDAELIQRVHQQRTKPEVGVATQASQVPRNLGPYTTSNGSYGVNKTPGGRVVSEAGLGAGGPEAYPPGLISPQSYGYGYGYGSGQETPQSVPKGYSYSGQTTPQHMMMGGGGGAGGYGGPQQSPQMQRGGAEGAYQPPRLAPGARPAPCGGTDDDCACCPHPQKRAPPSESSTPRFIREHDEYGADAGDEEAELYAYEQQLRARLMRAREADAGGAEPVSYEFSASKGFVETPREGAARWMDESPAVTPSAVGDMYSSSAGAGDRRVRFNM